MLVELEFTSHVYYHRYYSIIMNYMHLLFRRRNDIFLTKIFFLQLSNV